MQIWSYGGFSLKSKMFHSCSKEQMPNKHLCAGKGNVSLNILQQT